MKVRTFIRIVILSVVFVLTLIYGIKWVAEREAAGAPPIVERTDL